MSAIPDQFPDMVTRQPPSLMQRFNCFTGLHDWTSRIEMGAKPDPDRIKADPTGYFFMFAAPICRHCPKQLPPL